MEQPYAAIFDMDGVLIDSYDAHFRSWREIAEAEGFDFTEALFARGFGRTSREIITEVWGRRCRSDDEILALDARKELAFRRLVERNFPAMPGIRDVLAALHQAGFKLAVGSSGPPENVVLALDKLGQRELFDAVATGEDVRRGKPDPQVFLLAAERLAVPAVRCAVIEDAPAGIAAANAASMASVGFLSTGRRREDFSDARAVVRNAADITPRMLSSLIDGKPSSHESGART